MARNCLLTIGQWKCSPTGQEALAISRDVEQAGIRTVDVVALYALWHRISPEDSGAPLPAASVGWGDAATPRY